MDDCGGAARPVHLGAEPPQPARDHRPGGGPDAVRAVGGAGHAGASRRRAGPLHPRRQRPRPAIAGAHLLRRRDPGARRRPGRCGVDSRLRLRPRQCPLRRRGEAAGGAVGGPLRRRGDSVGPGRAGPAREPGRPRVAIPRNRDRPTAGDDRRAPRRGGAGLGGGAAPTTTGMRCGGWWSAATEWPRRSAATSTPAPTTWWATVARSSSTSGREPCGRPGSSSPPTRRLRSCRASTTAA